jgi:hypothetical protein
MFLTIALLAGTLLGCVLLGAPVAWLLNGRQPLDEEDWLQAPVLGLCVAVVAAYNLVNLNVRIAIGAPLIWLTTAGLWVWMIRSTHGGLADRWRATFGRFPRLAYLGVALVVAVHGIGLLVVGCEDYLGWGHSDQLNYTVIAQLLTDFPMSIGWDEIGQRPYLADALKVMHGDRLGAMVAQGFFATSLGQEASRLFQPVILLGPGLSTLMIVALARRVGLGACTSLLAGLAAALVPALSLIRFYGAFSQTLSVPLLFLALVSLLRCVSRPTDGSVLRAGLALAGTIAVYFELVPIVCGLCVLILLGGVILRLMPARRGVGILLALPTLTLALNPLYLPTLIQGIQRVRYPTTIGNPMQHVYRLRGLGTFWIHDKWAFDQGRLGTAVVVLAVLLTALAVVGLLRLVAGWRGLLVRAGWRDDSYRGRCLAGAAVVALCLLPVVVRLSGPQYPYQVCKLAASLSPAVVLAVAFGWAGCRVPRLWGSEPTLGSSLGDRAAASLAFCGLTLVLACGLVGTAFTSWETTIHKPTPRSAQHLTLTPEYRDLLHVLRQFRGAKIVLAAGAGTYFNSWPAYAARRNDVWLVNPCINDGMLLAPAAPAGVPLRFLPGVGRNLTDLDHLPSEVLVVISKHCEPQVEIHGDCRLIGGNVAYQVWHLGPGPYEIRPLPGAWRSTLEPSPAVASGK